MSSEKKTKSILESYEELLEGHGDGCLLGGGANIAYLDMIIRAAFD